jgi:tight adherence protein C
MTLATMMLTVPPLLIILIGPSIYDIYLMLGSGGQVAETPAPEAEGEPAADQATE